MKSHIAKNQLVNKMYDIAIRLQNELMSLSDEEFKALEEEHARLKAEYDAIDDSLPVMGRPPIGVTKKQSLTLQEQTWEWIDDAVKNGHASSRSEFLRDIVEFARVGKPKKFRS